MRPAAGLHPAATADDTPHPANFTGLDYHIDEAAMLAGYLAGSWSETGKIGTYGGQQFPGVTRFMDGLYAGVAYHNEQKDTTAEVLGWDGDNRPATSSAATTRGTIRRRAKRSPRP